MLGQILVATYLRRQTSSLRLGLKLSLFSRTPHAPIANQSTTTWFTTTTSSSASCLSGGGGGEKTRLFETSPTSRDLLFYQQIRTTLRSGNGYTKFAHGRYKLDVSRYAYFWYAFLMFMIPFIMFVDLENLTLDAKEPRAKFDDVHSKFNLKTEGKQLPTTASATTTVNTTTEQNDDDTTNEPNEQHDSEQALDGDDQSADGIVADKKSFRNRKIIEYENRIRKYSTPDKVFRYFATIKVWSEKLADYEVFMTPDDFVRSLTYGVKQPEGLGLDSFQRFDPNMQSMQLSTSVADTSVFRKINPHGLISFTDYMFLVTLLSISERHLAVMFHMFDVDASGTLNVEEFDELQSIIRSQTSAGQRHKDTAMNGSVIRTNSNLNVYLFGFSDDKTPANKTLSVDTLVAFQRQFLTEVVQMEFGLCGVRRRDADGLSVISESSFCEMMLAYANFPAPKRKRMLKRIAQLYGRHKASSDQEGEEPRGITLEEFERFFQMLRHIHDIEMALRFYTLADEPISKATLRHVARVVADVELSDHVIDVIFSLFDVDGDGKLGHTEFVKVMKKRMMRGLNAPKDTGFVRLVASLTSCTKEMFV